MDCPYLWYGFFVRTIFRNYIVYFLTFFYKAAKYKHNEVVKLLLAKGANIEALTDYDEFTPLLCGN
jgi:hypothetical protein